MAKHAELKKQLEKIAGRKIDLSEEQLRTFIWPLASSTYVIDQGELIDTWVTWERIIFPQPTCTDAALLDTSGVSETGDDGTLVFRLRNYLCGRDSIASFVEPVNLVATPQSTSPCYVTMTHELITTPPATWFTDVEITASSWSPNGKAAPNVRFYWRCRVPAYPIIE
jgi:hypothetical protein